MSRKLYDIIRYFYIGKFYSRLIFEYWAIFDYRREEKLTILEIGIKRGRSLRYWAHYFKHPETKIIGIDIKVPHRKFSKKISMYHCNQNDSEGLISISKKFGKFDIIIDDGVHFKKETENCFNILWDFVAPGGHYIIEDWAAMEDDDLLKKIHNNINNLKITEEKVALVPPKSLILFLPIKIPGKSIAFYKKNL